MISAGKIWQQYGQRFPALSSVTLLPVWFLVPTVEETVGEETVTTSVSLEGSSVIKHTSGVPSLTVINVEEIPVPAVDSESETGVLSVEDAVEVTVLKADVAVEVTILMGEAETVAVNRLRV
jgi:hypothetical protein